MRNKPLTLQVLGIFAVGLLLGSCYIAKQGSYFLRDQRKAEQISVLIEEGALSESQRDFFEKVARIRRYGIDVLGLPDTKGYTLYRETEKTYLVDVVSAAGELSFERYYWRYPVVGKLPYKGFYEREDAEKEAQKIKEKHYDVIIRHVDSFSTHGRFPEILYTFMEHYSESRLAELIFHEMAHGFLWLRNNAQFNEEFASFVGEQGMRDYLSAHYGTHSDIYEEMLQQRDEWKVFLARIDALRSELEELYQSDMEREKMLVEKKRVIGAFQAQFHATYDDYFQSDTYRSFADIVVNNAYLDLFATYYSNKALFFSTHDRLGGTLAESMEAMREAVSDTRADPYEAISGLR